MFAQCKEKIGGSEEFAGHLGGATERHKYKHIPTQTPSRVGNGDPDGGSIIGYSNFTKNKPRKCMCCGATFTPPRNIDARLCDTCKGEMA